MAAGDTLQGRRLADCYQGDFPVPYDDIRPGDYWKHLNDDGSPVHVGPERGNLTGTVWGFCAPRGGVGTLRLHTVREDEDGSISVRPGDGSSNSIAFGTPGTPQYWHGYIERGVWREA